MTATTTSLLLLDRSRAALTEACDAPTAAQRYVAAHSAAIRAAAAITATRASPGIRDARSRSVWETLPEVAPDMADWAEHFAGAGARRAAGAAGAPTALQAHDLLRDAEAFHHLVESTLGQPWQQLLPDVLPDVAEAAQA